MLRVIKRLKEAVNIPLKQLFLVPMPILKNTKKIMKVYIQLIINEMLPNIAAEDLADYIDVFCEQGFFRVEDMIRICEAGAKYGLKPKLHVNQLKQHWGIQAGIKLGAVSLDHLETMNGAEIKALAVVILLVHYCQRQHFSFACNTSPQGN
jgi:imidazolonepropionase